VKIKDIQLIKTSYKTENLLNDKRRKILFSGRSNVGKSTLFNRLVNRKKLAKVSSKPGKTRSINYYLINRKFYFVDLPGYGFAKVPKKEKVRWLKLLEEFFFIEKYVILLCLIVDVKVGITEYDEKMLSLASYYKIPTLIIANKIDKVNKKKLKSKINEIKNYTNIPALPFSAKKGTGKKQLWNVIRKSLQENSNDKKSYERD